MGGYPPNTQFYPVKNQNIEVTANSYN